MDIVVSDVPEGDLGDSKLEGTLVFGEVTIRLFGGGFFVELNAVVRQRLGGLLNIRIEQHRRGGRGAGARAEAEE